MAAAMDQARAQVKTATTQIAEEWKRMSAQIRAATATEASGVKEITAQRQQLADVLKREMSLHGDLSNATNKQLANYKAMTLELERQQSFLKGGPGLTGPTEAFLKNIGGMFSRMTGTLGASIFGVAGGSQLASGAAGIMGGITSGEVTGLSTAIAGLGAVVVGAAAAMHSLAVSGAEYVKTTDIVSQKTGISVANLQLLEAAGKRVNVGLDDIATGFRKFSQALTGAEVAGEDGGVSGQAKKLSKVLHDFGVTSRDPIEALKQLADGFQKLSDGPVKTAAAVQLLGRSGMSLIPILNEGRAGLESWQGFISNYGARIVPDVTRVTNEWEQANARLSTSWTRLKVDATPFLSTATKSYEFLATSVLPAIDSVVAGPHFLKTIGVDESGNPIYETLDKTAAAAEKAGVSNKKLADTIARDLAGAIDKGNRKLDEYYERLNLIARGSISLPGSISRSGSYPLFAPNLPQRNPDLSRQLSGAAGGAFGPFNTPRTEAPGLGITPDQFPSSLGGLFGFPGQSDKEKILDVVRSIDSDWYNETADTAQKIRDQYTKTIDELKKAQIEFANDPAMLTAISKGMQQIGQVESKQLENLGDEAAKKASEAAGKVFDALLSGNTKKIGKEIEKTILEAVLAPVKKQFEDSFGHMLENLGKIFTKGGGTTPAGGAGSSGGIFGGILSKFGIVPTFGGNPTLGGGHTGPVGIQTPQTNIQSGTVVISGAPAPLGGSAGSSFGNFFGANGVLGGFGNFFGNQNPFGNAFGPLSGPGGGATGGNAGSSGLATILKAIGPAASGAIMLGAGIASNNPTAMALGAAAIGQVGLNAIANQLSSAAAASQNISSTAQSLGKVSAALPGVGLYVAGVAQGGVGGTLEATAGGAMAGMAVGGPWGAAIGAGIGLVSGIISSVFGGGAKSFNQAVARDKFRQQYNAPGSENFSFAENGSIASTLGTGFNQLGSSFSKYALPANTPFTARAIMGPLTWQQRVLLAQESGRIDPNEPFQGFPTVNPYTGQGPLSGLPGKNRPASVTVEFHLPGLIDAASAGPIFEKHGDMLAQIVHSKFHSSSSGMGTTVRRLVNLP